MRPKTEKETEIPPRSETSKAAEVPCEDGYFKSVRALPDFHLEVVMQTETIILFDFHTRLNTVRFGKLRDEEFFRSVTTDGLYLIFHKDGRVPVRITASEFIDLVLVDRTKPNR